jgi:hypothetical protein
MTTEKPAFTGLAIHRDLKHRFSLLYPEGWVSAPAPNGAGGTVLVPDPDDRDTLVWVQGKRLRTTVQAGDLEALRAGFEDGLRRLPGAEIEHLEADVIRDLVTMEARHTFREGDAARKRWSRLLYRSNVQITVLAQGSSPERFDYWLPMFTTIMRTVQFADWWAEVTGQQWRARIDDADV